MDCSDEADDSCNTHFMCLDAKETLQTGIINRDLKSCVSSFEKCDGKSQCRDASDECGCADSVACPISGDLACYRLHLGPWFCKLRFFSKCENFVVG